MLPVPEKGTGGELRRQLSVATRRELIEAVAARYRAAGRNEKKENHRNLLAHGDLASPPHRARAPFNEIRNARRRLPHVVLHLRFGKSARRPARLRFARPSVLASSAADLSLARKHQDPKIW